MNAPNNARSIARGNAKPMRRAKHATYATYATNERDQDLCKKPYVPDAPNPVDNEILVTREELIRTRVVLAQLAGEQERLAAALDATGLTGFADRADWLIFHRTWDQQLVWRRHWRRLGISTPEPRRERFPRPTSFSVPAAPKPVPKPRPVLPPVIPDDRQMEIAMKALAKQEAA